MKYITLALAGALLFVLPQPSNAAEQCTTSELDLVCADGEVLQGIKSNGDKICVAQGSGEGGSFVALENGEVNHGDVILPIDGYIRSQCSLSLNGQPYESDGAYKRSRHYGVWHNVSGDGWEVQAGYRAISDGGLGYVDNARIQYQLTCSGVNSAPDSSGSSSLTGLYECPSIDSIIVMPIPGTAGLGKRAHAGYTTCVGQITKQRFCQVANVKGVGGRHHTSEFVLDAPVQHDCNPI